MYYIPIDACYEMLVERIDIQQEVEQWWEGNGWSTPALPMDKQPLGILARHVATCRYEDALFLCMCKKAGLYPVWMEYQNDTFVTRSKVKMSLMSPKMANGKRNKNNELIVVANKLANPDRWDGKPLDTVATDDGSSLLEWHHRHQDQMLVGEDYDRFDVTPFYRSIGPAKEYYTGLLSIFIAHGVLFEDYHGGESGGELDTFTNKIFLPAWEIVKKRFGVAPLIVKLPWWDELGYYPTSPTWRNHNVIPQEYL